jgi:hypothetical protein
LREQCRSERQNADHKVLRGGITAGERLMHQSGVLRIKRAPWPEEKFLNETAKILFGRTSQALEKVLRNVV